MENYRDIYEAWLASDTIDPASKEELRALTDEKEIAFRFSSYMEFGTGGLRSRMGAGTNMMNVYTIAHATEGVARLIDTLGEDAKKRGVVIGFDSRNHSAEFAARAGEVLTAHGIKVYLFDELRPTPCLSYGVRYFGCIAGINITASHNPSQYNGYKLYWEDGAQPTADMADKVSAYILETNLLTEVPPSSAAKPELVTMVGRDFDETYLNCLLKEQVYPDVIAKAAEDLKIVYTPLFGAGTRLVPEIMRRIGLKHIYPVEFQMTPNGDFPGLDKPNPEYPASFKLGIELAEEVKSDLIIATDPDADRVGIMARDKNGTFRCITGNQMGSLLLDYMFSALEEQGTMPADAYCVKTIVTSEMATEICRQHNVKLHNVLTGFKFIAEVIREHEEAGHGTYLLGYEESYGYLKGGHARDKDAVVAAMLICEMAAYYSLRGMTLIDAMESLYEKYGFYSEISAEIYMEGLDGKKAIEDMMTGLREKAPASLGGSEVVNIRDYLAELSYDVKNGTSEPTGLPKSNVMYYAMANGCVVVARPSGTEPKIKFYILACGKDSAEAAANTTACTASLEDILGLQRGQLKK
ncbi:MAG: phospho-sugar mutase [Ruminococcaceae bacterium]|nr:phospho-sugar mutase [Oscillospiraceae bacterium]